MKLTRTLTIAIAALATALAFQAQAAVKLTPASPQPDAATLKKGFAVRYAYPPDVRYLMDGDGYRTSKGVVDGKPIRGFDYPDKGLGAKVFTSKRDEKVIAYIKGYMRFDKAGIYRLQFWSNDGLRVKIGGKKVYEHDGRHVCDTLGWEEVDVPEPGWYAVDTLYFQRYKTSCMMLKWQPPGGAEAWAPVDVYRH